MEPQKESSEGEDIPSDFFDDFAKDDFIEGLSVVDQWDNDEHEKPRHDSKSKEGTEEGRNEETHRIHEQQPEKEDRRRSGSEARMDEFIKPGSRRDPNKTNEAIKKDKELKVKQHIAKHLESTEDLRPPGTELDDFYEENKKIVKNNTDLENPTDLNQNSSSTQVKRESLEKGSNGNRQKSKSKLQDKKRYFSPSGDCSWDRFEEGSRFYDRPRRYRDSPGKYRESPGRYRQAPGKFRNRAEKSRDFGRRHASPPRYERRTYSNRKSPSFYRNPPSRHQQVHHSRSPHSEYRKERRYPSPRGSPSRMSRRSRSSRSPRHQYERYRSRSPQRSHESSIQPHNEYGSSYYGMGPPTQYPAHVNYTPGDRVDPNVPPLMQNFSIPQPQMYPGYNALYQYDVNALPQPVPAPIPAPGSAGLAPLTSPQQVVTPVLPSGLSALSETLSISKPVDALAKLVTDGILSHEDYLKLAPNKGALQGLDGNAKTAVLNRCHSAVSKLDELLPPNRLIVSSVKKIGTHLKAIAPQFFSPLKKKPIAEFSFTKLSASDNSLKNKQIIDIIVSTLDLHDIVGRTKKNNMKDVAVQTTTPQCDKCFIRQATLQNEVGTSIDQDHFSSSTHTQVVEEDLHSSKSVFNASGSTASAPISFAHMTSAQLVSQLVARAKTLKQPDSPAPNQYQGRHHYDDKRDPHYRNNYSNYRY